MGSGIWSTDVYSAAASYRAAKGSSAFAYSDSGARSAHPDLDPHEVTLRESRDSAEHPNSLAVAVLFDVTGSMGGVPRTLQTKLPDLLGLLLRKGYATDPQILFGAIGDATCDRSRCRSASSSPTTGWTSTWARSCLRAGAAAR